MAEQVRVVKKVDAKESADMAELDAEIQAAQKKEVEVHGDLDDLMDEIDSVLEEQDVLVNFRQKGGE